MNIYIVPLILLFVFAFSGCDDHDEPTNEVEDFDLEWNKDMNIEENTMYYIDNDGIERTINIANTDISFYPYDGYHSITMKDVTDEKLEFHWGYEKEEIKAGHIQLIPRFYVIYPEEKIRVGLRGMLNIIEVSNDELIPGTYDNRKINIKAMFHIKKDFYHYPKDTFIETKESKGVFYYSGVEIRGPWLGGS